MNTVEKIQKITSKGQITLPVAWRRATGAHTITVTTRGNRIEIAPARLQKKVSERTIFDAIRDNNGKGIKIDKLIAMLEKLRKEDERH
jgi:bifunctional DNA-binding transcriptional regulator/antitoxin component of YhaV-PrlF toxin-antitoxin module